MSEPIKCFFKTEYTPLEYAEKTAQMTTKDLDYYRNLADKAAAGSEKTDSNFQSSTVGKMLLPSIAGHREREPVKGRHSGLHCYLVLGNGHNHPSLQQLLP